MHAIRSSAAGDMTYQDLIESVHGRNPRSHSPANVEEVSK
jgi:hypothetical protein